MDYRALVQKLGDRTNQNTQTSELILEHRTGHPSYQFNNKWDAGIEVGIQKGDVCKISPVGDATTFTIAPYVRYAAVESKVVDLFFEGTIGYGSVSKGGGDFYEVGIKPGLAVKLTKHVEFISKIGFLGYRGYSPEEGKSSSTFGVDVDASNISFGAIYKF